MVSPTATTVSLVLKHNFLFLLEIPMYSRHKKLKEIKHTTAWSEGEHWWACGADGFLWWKLTDSSRRTDQHTLTQVAFFPFV